MESPSTVTPDKAPQPPLSVLQSDFQPSEESFARVDRTNFAFAAPGLDMTSALALLQSPHLLDLSSESLDLGSARETSPEKSISLDEARRLPAKALRDELVRLYFRHVHSLCPIIDEFRFCEAYYSADSDDELLDKVDVCLLQAMMFAAFTVIHLRNEMYRNLKSCLQHISESWLYQGPYRSLPEGQRNLVDKARVLYKAGLCKDDVVLTQVALLLSYWSPYDSDDQVNTFWVSRAFHHARAARLWDHACDSQALHCRRRLIWWCCLIRDRLTCYGLRRPEQLQESDTRWVVPDYTNFGLEVLFPRFADVTSKRTMIKAFMWLCKLSNFMVSLILHPQISAKRHYSSSGQSNFKDNLDMIQKVRSFENQLDDWKKAYQKESRHTLACMEPCFRVQLYMLNVMNSSLMTSLFCPFVRAPSDADPLIEKFRLLALQKVKESSGSVAELINRIQSESEVEDIPQIIVAWIVLPIVVYQVDCRSRDGPADLSSSNHLARLMYLLSALHSRFGGVQFVSRMVAEVNELIDDRKQRLASTSLETSRVELSTLTCHSEDDTEVELLDCAVRLVDLSLAESPSPVDLPRSTMQWK